MELFGKTDVGRVRRQNQDAFYISEMAPVVLLVCDGMGGAKAGNVASAMAVEVFKAECGRLLTEDTAPEDLEVILPGIVDLCNETVFELSHVNEDYDGMGTTLVAAVCCGDRAVVINVGDSRCYRLSHGVLTQVTKDHSLVQDMVDRGDITREESRTHPHKNLITRAVGTMSTVETDLFTVPMETGDLLLLASDGLTNVVTDREIEDELRATDSARASGERLLDCALRRGAPDNVTLVLYRK